MSTPIDEHLQAHAERLRELHHGEELLVLTNVWDVASAELVARRGAPAIATASAAITASLGYPDADSIPPAAMLAAVSGIASAVRVPVSADLEAGYGLPASELVGGLLEAGAVGLNFEDTDHRGPGELVEAEAQAERLARIKDAGRAAGVDVVLNARVDAGDLDEAVRRGRLYREAGADCVYPIAFSQPDDVSALVAGIDGPVNVLVRPGAPSLAELRGLGVARVSFGPGLQRVALAALERFLDRMDPEKPVYN